MSPIPYKISRIETKQFATLFDGFDLQKGYEFNIDCNFTLNSTQNALSNTMDIVISQDEKTIIKAVVCCYYSIEQTAFEKIKTDGEINVYFLRYIATFTIGAARGIISAKTEGTRFNEIILPPVNLNEYIKDNFKINV